jgi:L-malate glycosyltransferase
VPVLAPARIGIAGPVSLDLLADHLSPTPASAGNACPLIAHLVLELLARGHRITVFTTQGHGPTANGYRGDRLTVHAIPVRRARYRTLDLSATERRHLRRLIAGSGCDLIHAHWNYEFALAALAAGRPTLVTAHDWAPRILRMQTDPYVLSRLAMSWPALRAAPHLTAVSPYLAGKVALWTRAGARPPTIVPNGVPTALLRSHRDRPNRRALVLGAVCNGFSHLKNTATLLRAFALVRRHLGARLVLVGAHHGPGEPAERWAAQHGLAGEVEFRGLVPAASLPEQLDSFDVLVHPALEESFGMAVLEAMARRVPVIGGRDAGAVPWVLDEGRSGVLTDVSDAHALARSILALAADPVLRQRLASVAHERARTQFTLPAVTDRYEELYRDIMTS